MPDNTGVDSSPMTNTTLALAETLDQMSKGGQLAEGLKIRSVIVIVETDAPNKGMDVIARWDGPMGKPASRHRILGMLSATEEHVRKMLPL